MRRLVTLVLLLALALPVAPAAEPPSGAQQHIGNSGQIAHWVGNETNASTAGLRPGDSGTAWFALRSLAAPNATDDNSTNASRHVRVTINSTAATFTPAALNLTLNATNWTTASSSFAIAANATAGEAYNFTATLYETTANGTAVLDVWTVPGPAVVAAVVPVPAPLIPTPWLIGGGIALLVAVAAGAYSVRERRLRARMRGQARSQVMREMELEQKLEKVREKDPGQAVAIQQEIRQQEVVREKRRELQILEAKRADVLKNMDLLRKRHETGGLSKLQFDNMMAKRQADLTKIEAEIAEMERQDASAA